MKFKVVLNILGKLLIVLAGFLLLPLIVTWYYQENDLLAFVGPSVLSLLVGLVLSKYTKGNDEISNREGFAIVSMIWILFSVFGGLPYMISSPSLSFTDSFFETMSGFTTTGSSVMQNIQGHTKGILLWRSITQWIGGMGIIVLSLAILPILGIGGMQLFKAEVPGPTSDKLTPKIKDTAKILWEAYIFLTFLQATLLFFAGMSPYDAICHSLTTLSSGGFSPNNTSIAHYETSAIHFIISLFMIFAGVNFANHYQFSRRNFSALFKDVELKAYLGVMLVVGILLCLNLMLTGQYSDIFLCFRDVLFTTTSMVTTTGFATADFETWPLFSQFLIFCLMFTGGCAGSTGGGIKIVRLIIFLKFAYQQVYQLIHPKAILQLKLNQRMVKTPVILGIMGFLVLYVFSFFLGTLIMSATGLDFTTAVTATASCLGNIGPGLAMVGPTDNFSQITDFGKWVLAFLML
ncbi:TrkH family potassium uptake protein, partial [bacterium]|nr:TrkH family potassium uptake protein [bacterium]